MRLSTVLTQKIFPIPYFLLVLYILACCTENNRSKAGEARSLKPDKSTIICTLGGILTGIVNGLLGAGGGMIAVPLLSKVFKDTKAAHINSVALILPLCVFSAVMYFISGNVSADNKLPILILFGLGGSVFGTWIMQKISGKWLKKIFSALLIYSGVRMLLA